MALEAQFPAGSTQAFEVAPGKVTSNQGQTLVAKGLAPV